MVRWVAGVGRGMRPSADRPADHLMFEKRLFLGLLGGLRILQRHSRNSSRVRENREVASTQALASGQARAVDTLLLIPAGGILKVI